MGKERFAKQFRSKVEVPNFSIVIEAGEKKLKRLTPCNEQPWFNIAYPQAGVGCSP